MKYLFNLIWIVAYVFGIAIAKGFWMTCFSLFPLVAFVETAKWLIERFSSH